MKTKVNKTFEYHRPQALLAINCEIYTLKLVGLFYIQRIYRTKHKGEVFNASSTINTVREIWWLQVIMTNHLDDSR